LFLPLTDRRAGYVKNDKKARSVIEQPIFTYATHAFLNITPAAQTQKFSPPLSGNIKNQLSFAA